jgi:hypothetical protein
MGIFGRKKKKGGVSMDPMSNTLVAEAVAASARSRPERAWQPPPKEYEELGTIHYANLTADGRHGDYETALAIAAETGKPIFANFVEWSG